MTGSIYSVSMGIIELELIINQGTEWLGGIVSISFGTVVYFLGHQTCRVGGATVRGGPKGQ